MKLRDYLNAHELTMAAFGAKLGVSHATVVRYCNGSRKPSWRVMEKIERVTLGDVVAADFFPPAKAAA